MTESPIFKQHVMTLLEKAGLSTTILSIQPCASGGNNRTYRLETVDGLFAVKQYFRQPGDTRDRLEAEFAFLSYAKNVTPHQVPIPYSQEVAAGMALYEFIDGVPFKAEDMTEKTIQEAVQFFCALNAPHQKVAATQLPFASEACFSIEEHLSLIAKRIQSLQQIELEIAEDKTAAHFVKQLNAYWEFLLAEIKNTARTENIDVKAILSPSARCISPSDFGFHNALKMADGSIRFLDFEYAGWDDPAKMTGDFFSQLAIPIPAHYFNPFVEAVMAPFPKTKHLVHRAQLLRAVYQVKWCCIALNIFIPVNLARRRFANPNLNVVHLKKNQLLKAESLLQRLGVLNHG